MANAVLSRDPLSQGPRDSGSKLPRPRGTTQGPTPKKAPPRTLPRVPWAQRDRPGRQTHVTRGTNFPGTPSDHSATLRARDSFTHCACVANHPLNTQPLARASFNPKEALPSLGLAAAPPVERNRPEIRLCLLGGRAAPPRRRRGAAATGVATHNAPTRETARQKGRAAALPERAARAKFHRAHPRRRHPKLFTSLCARKRAQNINSRAPATHRT